MCQQEKSLNLEILLLLQFLDSKNSPVRTSQKALECFLNNDVKISFLKNSWQIFHQLVHPCIYLCFFQKKINLSIIIYLDPSIENHWPRGSES